jgi:hypothetical protein
MAISTGSWRPSWWTEETHGSAWERVKEALRRDWEQTKKDLHLGGHELNQGLTDTLKQATGKQSIPPDDGPNPPKVIGDWDDIELPMGYGYNARQYYGTQHSDWDDELEGKLKTEWESAKATGHRGWNDVKQFVRHGYERGKTPS